MQQKILVMKRGEPISESQWDELVREIWKENGLKHLRDAATPFEYDETLILFMTRAKVHMASKRAMRYEKMTSLCSLLKRCSYCTSTWLIYKAVVLYVCVCEHIQTEFGQSH